MKTLELTATIGPDRKLIVQLPGEVLPGRHQVLVVIDEVKPRPAAALDLPVHDMGPWPENLSLRREDMYGDDGR